MAAPNLGDVKILYKKRMLHSGQSREILYGLLAKRLEEMKIRVPKNFALVMHK
jgi:hypothetical protein